MTVICIRDKLLYQWACCRHWWYSFGLHDRWSFRTLKDCLSVGWSVLLKLGPIHESPGPLAHVDWFRRSVMGSGFSQAPRGSQTFQEEDHSLRASIEATVLTLGDICPVVVGCVWGPARCRMSGASPASPPLADCMALGSTPHPVWTTQNVSRQCPLEVESLSFKTTN